MKAAREKNEASSARKKRPTARSIEQAVTQRSNLKTFPALDLITLQGAMAQNVDPPSTPATNHTSNWTFNNPKHSSRRSFYIPKHVVPGHPSTRDGPLETYFFWGEGEIPKLLKYFFCFVGCEYMFFMQLFLPRIFLVCPLPP